MDNCNDEHIFEILGIDSREDSYTDLIHYAFMHSSEFQKKLLVSFKQQYFDDWESIVRPTVTIKSDTGRKKDIPDMIIFSGKAQRIILIENKTFSGEGWKQTESYSDQKFQFSLLEYLEKKGKAFNNPGFAFYYLTLEGKSPVSDKFIPKKYKDITDCIPDISGNSKLDILLKELKERVNKYEDWPKPKNKVVVRDYLHKTKWLVNSFRTFTIMSKNLLDTKNVPMKECSITANRGSGYIPLCLWRKNTWIGQEYSNEIDGAKCYDIHFEFQWDTRSGNENLTLYLHYHTNPYMTNSAFEKLNEIFKNSYKNNRDVFYNFVNKNSPPLWHIKKTSLQIARYNFDSEIEYGDLKERANALISNMTPIIDEFIGKM